MLSLRNWHLICAAIVLVALGAYAHPQESATPLLIAKQGSFFIGGRDVYSNTLSTNTLFPPTGTITVDQVYVRYQAPVGADPTKIVLVHGCCLTGKTWETTPDGRPGWDEHFLRKGYSVYVVDQAARGRSAADPSLINSVKVGNASPDRLPDVFSAGHEAAWTVFRFGPEYPKVYPGMRFPLDAIGEFWKQMVPDWMRSLPTPNPTVFAISELAAQLESTVLVSHSQSGIYPFQTVALDAKGIAAIVSIEPAACPDAAADVSPYVKVPILVLWGDYVSLSSRWSPRLKACQAFADAVNERGGRVENVELPTLGIRGNSHMLMQDDNNLQVADWLLTWIDRNIGGIPER
jgi:pimeloyl-ACP methyl ester carboxylesterase